MSVLKQRTARFGAALAAVVLGATAATAEARTLSFASGSPPTATDINQALQWWADELKARSDGSLDVEFYYMGSLVKLKDAVDGISAGIADMGYVIPAYSQSKMPLWYLSSTAIGSGDQYVTMEAFGRVRERFPELKAEEDKNNMHYIGHCSIGPTVLMNKGVWNSLSKKEQQVIDELYPELMRRMAQGDIADTEGAKQKLENDPKHPMKIYDLNAEQRKPWAEGLKVARQEKAEVTKKYNPAAPCCALEVRGRGGAAVASGAGRADADHSGRA